VEEERKPQRVRITIHLDDWIFDFVTRSDKIQIHHDGGVQFPNLKDESVITVPGIRLLFYEVKVIGEL